MKLGSPVRSLARGSLTACAASALIAALPVQQACAARVDWAGSRFVYETNGSSVTEVLNVFASGQHIPIRIDGPIEGGVGGRFSMPPQRFLDTLAKVYGFVWYYDGAVLQVSLARAQVQVALRPHVLAPAGLVAALQQAGVADAHFPLSVDDVAHTVDVVGPVTYVAYIRAAAERFERDADRRGRTIVRVFHLKSANAADVTRVIDGRTVVVPGAATLLRRRFERPVPAAGVHAPQQVVGLGTPLPAIEADGVTNSILVRDKPERIDADGVLVADLDVPAQLVAVQTWVVGVDADAFDSLQSALPPALVQTDEGSAEPGFGVAPDGGRALLARIDALAKAGRAQIEVSQTALTEDRSPAVVDRHEERLVRRKDGDQPEDPTLDLWLSVRATVDGIASAARIDLDVELGRSGDAWRFRRIEESVAAGECLVIAAPGEGAADTQARARLVLLIPRVAA